MPGEWLDARTAEAQRTIQLSRLPVAILAGLMAIWTPVTFALEASGALSRLLIYGVPGILLLVGRGCVAGLGVAAGRALWSGRPGGPALARTWLLLDAVASTVAILTPYFPGNRLPGTKGTAIALVVTFNAAWFLYLAYLDRAGSDPGGR